MYVYMCIHIYIYNVHISEYMHICREGHNIYVYIHVERKQRRCTIHPHVSQTMMCMHVCVDSLLPLSLSSNTTKHSRTKSKASPAQISEHDHTGYTKKATVRLDRSLDNECSYHPECIFARPPRLCNKTPMKTIDVQAGRRNIKLAFAARARLQKQ